MRFDLRLLVALILTRLPGRAKGSSKDAPLPDHVTRNLDPNVSPCQDFYAHACGNWSAVHMTDSYGSQLQQLDYDYEERLAQLLERGSPGKEARFLQLPRDFYASCRRSLDMPQALAFLERLVTSPSLGPHELTVALTAAFRLEVLVEMDGTKMREIWLQLLLRTEPEWNLNETNRQPLQRHQFDQLWPQNTPLDQAEFWQELSVLEEFMMQDPEEGENEDEGEWATFLLENEPPAFWMMPWRRSPPSVRYIKLMTMMLTAKTPRFLITYILLRLRLAAAGGGLASAKAWHVKRSECAEQCRQLLSHPSVWLLEKDQPRLPEEPVLQGIFRTLKHRFGQKLRANRNGFGKHSLKFLLSKLEHMSLRLSVLPRQKSAQSLERRIARHYQSVHLNASDYYGNLLATLVHSTVKQLPLIGPLFPWLTNLLPPHKRGQPLPVQVHGFGSFGSPFYMLTTNTLVVPLSLLGPPLYTAGQSELLTYSSLGFILGHELTHGFTPDAVPLDSRGRRHLDMVLELLRVRRYQQQVSCLHTRYGREQLDEKFADSNGLELAYSAYFDAAEGDRRWDEHSTERGGPTSSSLQRQQHFFLNFAQFFCSVGDSSQDSDDHGSDRKRVNDAVASFEPFQQAFSCKKPVRSRYHKAEQCRLY